MSLYLIAHKVRGEPAFDVAQKMICPHCDNFNEVGCAECDHEGHWWIIPTSGHRAYPYDHTLLDDLKVFCSGDYDHYPINPGPIPAELRDHYESPHHKVSEAESKSSGSLLSRLGLAKPTKIERRI